MKNINIQAIILAAGKGTRMKSDMPKCAYPFFNRPMIRYIINSCNNANIKDICVIVGHKKEAIKDILKDSVSYAYQEEQLGTAHAVLKAKSFFKDKEGVTIILPGDMPLIKSKMISDLIEYHINNNNDLTVVTTTVNNPTGYGRIVKENNKIIEIVEEKDASDTIKKIKEINTSLYCVNTNLLESALLKVDNNNLKKEYYLTDIVKILANEKKVDTFQTDYDYRLIGINDLYTLSYLEKLYQQEINKNHLLNGVHLINPDSILIDDEVKIGSNVTIDANSIIRGKTYIKDNTYIKPYSLIIDGEKIN